MLRLVRLEQKPAPCRPPRRSRRNISSSTSRSTTSNCQSYRSPRDPFLSFLSSLFVNLPQLRSHVPSHCMTMALPRKSKSDDAAGDDGSSSSSQSPPSRSAADFTPLEGKESLHVVVIVLGDLGRSPRIQYHANSLLQSGHAVSLVGYVGEVSEHFPLSVFADDTLCNSKCPLILY